MGMMVIVVIYGWYRQHAADAPPRTHIDLIAPSHPIPAHPQRTPPKITSQQCPLHYFNLLARSLASIHSLLTATIRKNNRFCFTDIILQVYCNRACIIPLSPPQAATYISF